MIIKPCIGSTLSLESYLIFINPQFMLYHAPINSSIIFPTQLDRFMKKLNLSSSIINGSHNILSDKLISQHKTDCPFSRIPLYDICSFFIRTRFLPIFYSYSCRLCVRTRFFATIPLHYIILTNMHGFIPNNIFQHPLFGNEHSQPLVNRNPLLSDNTLCTSIL